MATFKLDENDLATFMEGMGYDWEMDYDDYPDFVEGCKDTAKYLFNTIK